MDKNLNIKATNFIQAGSPNNANADLYGIFLTGSTGSVITCNQVQNTDKGIAFEGACSASANRTTRYEQNNHYTANYGYVLQNTGVIGTQGSSSVCIDNIYGNTGSQAITLGHTNVISTTNANTASTIGNFFDDANSQVYFTNWNDPIHDSSAYYYIDNVFVYEIPGLTGVHKNFQKAPSITLYPNPSNGEFTISSSSSFQKNEELNIFNVNRKLVSKSVLKGKKTTLNLSDLNEGIYYYTIQQNNKLLNRDKIVIIK